MKSHLIDVIAMGIIIDGFGCRVEWNQNFNLGNLLSIVFVHNIDEKMIVQNFGFDEVHGMIGFFGVVGLYDGIEVDAD